LWKEELLSTAFDDLLAGLKTFDGRTKFPSLSLSSKTLLTFEKDRFETGL
jgi:hypothetical protein